MSNRTTAGPAGLDIALAMAGRGWSVFPLVPRTKRPAVKDWPNRATTERARITTYWSHPACARHGVGVACGPSGLLVIDLDQPKPGDVTPPRWQRPGIHDGADVFACLCEDAGQPFPFDTYTVRTWRGGTHLYFTHPPTPNDSDESDGLDGPNEAGQGQPVRLTNTSGEQGNGLGWKIDTRGHGGYVVAAGCLVGGRPYELIYDTHPAPLPAWLTQRLTPSRQHPTNQTAAVGPVRLTSGDRSAYVAAAVRDEYRHVVTAESDHHNKALYIAAQNLGQLVAGGALSEAEVVDTLLAAERQLAATCPEPHTERQALATINSGLRHGAKRPRKVAA